MPTVATESFELSLAMGDPLSICSDPAAAASEMRRTTRPGGIVIATADNKLAALDHYVERGNLDALEEFIKTGRTQWLTADERERFELKTFTPASLSRLFEKAGFEVLSISGKTIIPIRDNKRLLEGPAPWIACSVSRPTWPATPPPSPGHHICRSWQNAPSRRDRTAVRTSSVPLVGRQLCRFLPRLTP